MQGQIQKALSGFYYVATETGEVYQTRGRGNFRKKKITPLVGDKVIFSADNFSEGVLTEILPRKNQLVRPPVANVDLGVIVMSAVTPQFSYSLLDRFLTQLEFFNIKGLLYLTKLDLVTDLAPFEAVKNAYEKIGYPVILGKSEKDFETLTKHFKKQVTVFIGQSGAGKSTLLNHLDPKLTLATGEISESLGRGRHTTRHVELHSLFGGLVADTPGFSSLELPESLEATQVGRLFPEIHAASAHCKFRQCLHVKEPGCEVLAKLATGEILPSRYENYLQFLNEVQTRKPIYGKKKEF